MKFETDSGSLVGKSGEDFELDVFALSITSSERGRTTDDKGIGSFAGLHGADKVLQVGADPRIGVGRNDERVSFSGENGLSCRSVGIDDSDDLETRS